MSLAAERAPLRAPSPPARRPVTAPRVPADPRAPSPAREPAARPRTAFPPRHRRRARRGNHPVFWALAAATVAGMLIGVVSLGAMLDQVAFRAQALEERMEQMREREGLLVERTARLSSPARVAEWAAAHDLEMPAPGDVVILHSSGRASGHAGQPDSEATGSER